MLRIASSKVFPYTVGAISFRGSTLTNPFNGCDQNSLVPFPTISHKYLFSTDAKKQIDVKIISKSEVKLKQMPVAIPNEFPFTIKDNPWERHITLSRNFDGEKIDVVVGLPICYKLEDFEDETYFTELDTWLADSRKWLSYVDDDVSSDDDDESQPYPAALMLEVKVSKQNDKILEFDVCAYAYGEIPINYCCLFKESASNHLAFGRYVPQFMYRNETTDLKEFLKVRGIKRSNYGFLFEYMYMKYKKYPVVALEKLRNFISE